jgi:toxin ParE1/3/4
MKVNRRPAAKLDVLEIAAYIGEHSPRTARRFTAAVRESISQLAQWPQIGALLDLDDPQFAGVRRWPVIGFPNHFIFYRFSSEGIDVIRILQGAREIQAALTDEMIN